MITFFFFLILFTPTIFSLTISQNTSLESSNNESEGRFGSSISVTNNYLVIGAPFENAQNSDDGRVYVYKKNISDNLFYEIDNLTSSFSVIEGKFGSDVSIFGEFLVIGAPRENGNQGRVHIFKRNTTTNRFNFLHSIISETPEFAGEYGSSISLYGDFLVVGALGEDDGDFGRGKAYLYKKNTSNDTFNLLQNISSPTQTFAGLFGTQVFLYQDYLVISAIGENSASGRVHIFKRNTTTDTFYNISQIESPNAISGAGFGTSISLDENYLFIGAPGENALFTGDGRAYVYRINSSNNTLYLTLSLTSPSPEDDGNFGNSVSNYGEYAVIGARFENVFSVDDGQAHLYKKNTTTENFSYLHSISSLNPQDSSNFGFSTLIYENTIYIGASLENASEFQSGRVYSYDFIDSNSVNLFPSTSSLFPLGGIFISILIILGYLII